MGENSDARRSLFLGADLVSLLRKEAVSKQESLSATVRRLCYKALNVEEPLMISTKLSNNASIRLDLLTHRVSMLEIAFQATQQQVS